MMTTKHIRRLLVAALLTTSILIGFASAPPDRADAHALQAWKCKYLMWNAAPNGARYAWRLRCEDFRRGHSVAHRRMAQVKACVARPESAMPWGVCRAMVMGNLPGWYTANPSLHRLLQKESGGGDCYGRRWMAAVNCSSGACRVHQFLPCRGLGPVEHMVAGYWYIKRRYGSPEAALRFHRARGWY